MAKTAVHARDRRGAQITSSAVIKALAVIPGIGKSLAADLMQLGYTSVAQLKGADPQQMYDRLCDITQARQDPCVLYTFRCAVYYASTPNPDPEKLKWWNWKEGGPALSQAPRHPQSTPSQRAKTR